MPPRKFKEYTFDISNMELDTGDATVFVTGRAKYIIEDIGNGWYEMGSIRDKDTHKVAVFQSCKITDWKMTDDCGKEKDGERLTADDIKALEEVIVEEMNYNLELCYELASLGELPDKRDEEQQDW